MTTNNDREDSIIVDVVLMFLGIALCIVVGTSAYFTGKDTANHEWQVDTVKRGYAEYVITDGEGRVGWKWKGEK